MIEVKPTSGVMAAKTRKTMPGPQPAAGQGAHFRRHLHLGRSAFHVWRLIRKTRRPLIELSSTFVGTGLCAV